MHEVCSNFSISQTFGARLSVRHCLEHVRYKINLVDMNVLLDNCMVLQ